MLHRPGVGLDEVPEVADEEAGHNDDTKYPRRTSARVGAMYARASAPGGPPAAMAPASLKAAGAVWGET